MGYFAATGGVVSVDHLPHLIMRNFLVKGGMLRRILLGVSLSALSLISLAAAAQDNDAQAVRRSFSPTDFERFAPRTALEMAQQTPAFSINEGGEDRGLGQADTNVLINGRRISGKSNGPVEALGRIPAADVVRLEILDGASLNISGLSGQVLNIVTASNGGISGQFRYSPQIRTDDVPVRWGDAEISVSGSGAQSDWAISLKNEQRRFGDAGPEFVFDGAYDLVETRQERRKTSLDTPGLSGSFSRIAANGNVLNLSGEVNGFFRRTTEISERGGVLDSDRTRMLRETEDEFNYELGADYEFGIGDSRLKLIGLYRYENSPTVGSVRFDFVNGARPTGSVFTRQANEAEAIIRSELLFDAIGGDWQWSVEGARNFLDIEARLEERDSVGALQAVVFPGATSRVEENRAETTISYGRAITPKLRLQTSAGFEYSQITQSGSFGLSRDFVRPKGFLSLNWEAADSLSVSAKLERVVGQLDFFDFIASVNVNEAQINVTNVNLVPPQSWLLELELQRSLGDFGSATLRGFAEDISDIVDQIPIGGGGQAPGNIANARRYGAAASLTFLSDPLGWRGARIDLNVDFIDSEVLDPLLGTPRRISAEDYFNLEATFRQDIPDTNWAAGVTISHQEDTPTVRLDEISVRRESFAFGTVFVERKNVLGLTLRATVRNVLDRDNDFIRTVFNDRLASDIAFREERFRNFGTIFTFDIEGSF